MGQMFANKQMMKDEQNLDEHFQKHQIVAMPRGNILMDNHSKTCPPTRWLRGLGNKLIRARMKKYEKWVRKVLDTGRRRRETKAIHSGISTYSGRRLSYKHASLFRRDGLSNKVLVGWVQRWYSHSKATSIYKMPHNRVVLSLKGVKSSQTKLSRGKEKKCKAI